MRLNPKTSLGRIAFRSQLIAAFSVGIVCLSLLSWVIIYALTSHSLEQTFLAQGKRVTESFARESTLALLYQSTDNAQIAARATLAFPDVLGVEIYDTELERLFAQGAVDEAHKIDTALLADSAILYRETAAAWHFAVAVSTGGSPEDEDSPFVTTVPQPELLGGVRVAIGKETLNALAAETLRGNLYTLAVGALLLLFLLALAARLTRPLQKLAETMNRARQGDKGVRADLDGPREVGMMGTAFNTMMSVLEQRETELEKARDAALESARLKGEFVTNVSHDLRTPMNGVLGMLEVLHGMKLSSKQREYVEVAASSGRALLSLIDDLLDFSRIESGRLTLRMEDFSLHETLEDMMDLFAGQVRKKHLELAYGIEPGVPAMLRGDPVRLRQVLINLVGNAIKFTDVGSVHLEVAAVPDSGQGCLRLRFDIHDTGSGVRPDDVEHIFEPFAQADGSPSRKYDGAGLGLAICRQMVALMGGEIGVDPRGEEGSTFWFTANLDHAQSKSAAEQPPAEELAGMRVLIVDADETTRGLLEQMLVSWNVRCDSAGEGRQAVAMLRTAMARGAPFDMVLIDELTRGMSSGELIDEISGEASISRTQVIVLRTRWQDNPDRTPPQGQSAFLEKPVRKLALLDTIHGVLSTRDRKTVSAQSSLARHFAELTGCHILIVEDNRTNQQVAQAMLERLGCVVTLTANGVEALDVFASGVFDAILMDCNMPEMDGYEATRQLRELNEPGRRVPIIAMTANVQQTDVDRCFQTGMDDYLAKPLKLERLQEKLELWLTRSRTSVNKVAGVELLDSAPGGPLNAAVLEELRSSIGDAFYTMVQVTLEDLPAKLSSLSEAIENADVEAMTAISHDIKGNARTFGAHHLAASARSLEELGQRGSMNGASRVLQEVLAEAEHVCTALAQQKGKTRSRQAQIGESAPRILIVDDDRGIRFALRTALEVNGYRIEEAGNGAQALALCERHIPDLVLMDAMMPVMDGFEASRQIRELPGGVHTPVLIITALDDEDSIDKAFAAGAIDYVPKPVHFAVLRQRVSRLLQASQAQERVRRLAYRDTLTGLPNRAHFMERMSEAIARRALDGRMLAVLFIDLDRFKLVNDTLGHDTGDVLLKGVAERVQGCLRAGDLVARLGGDEFTILLDNIDTPRAASTVAGKVGGALARPFVFGDRQLYVSASIGISVSPSDGGDINTLIKHADTAMFRAKEKGNRFEFYEHTMSAAVSRQLELEGAIRTGLEQGQFVVYYQPQKELASGQIVCAEALVRWQHPKYGLIMPGEFIPVAEQTGLIVPLGEHVLQAASAQVQAWHAHGYPPIRLAVNLSARQFDEPDLVERIGLILGETALDPKLLELEITESAIMKRPHEAISVLMQLKAMGITLAIDDFGTGYSSLSYLKRFPIDNLKIDRSFVCDLTTDSDDAAITSGIIALAHGLRLTVTAEGLESEQHERFLRENRCDLIQGFFVSKPLPAQRFEEQFLALADKLDSA